MTRATIRTSRRWQAPCVSPRYAKPTSTCSSGPRPRWAISRCWSAHRIRSTTAYKTAIAINDKAWFDLRSCRAQLQLLQDLNFNPPNVEAGIATFDRALERLTKPEDRWQPQQVFLFSGHRDRRAGPGRAALPRRQGIDRSEEDRRDTRPVRCRSRGHRVLPGRVRRRSAVPRGVPEARSALPGITALPAA